MVCPAMEEDAGEGGAVEENVLDILAVRDREPKRVRSQTRRLTLIWRLPIRKFEAKSLVEYRVCGCVSATSRKIKLKYDLYL